MLRLLNEFTFKTKIIDTLIEQENEKGQKYQINISFQFN